MRREDTPTWLRTIVKMKVSSNFICDACILWDDQWMWILGKGFCLSLVHMMIRINPHERQPMGPQARCYNNTSWKGDVCVKVHFHEKEVPWVDLWRDNDNQGFEGLASRGGRFSYIWFELMWKYEI